MINYLQRSMIKGILLLLLIGLALTVSFCGSQGGSGKGDGSGNGAGSEGKSAVFAREKLNPDEDASFKKEMISIPAGEFMMGSNEYDPDEEPMHKLSINEFLLDKYEVTNAMFKAFVDATNYQSTAEQKGMGQIPLGETWNDVSGITWYRPLGDKEIPEFEKQPVVQVSWYDAVSYCQWRKKRLPTEAEWEYAAGGKEHAMYCLGAQFEEAKYAYNLKGTKPVGSYPANSFGVFDTGGNVWEWVSTIYDDFKYPYDSEDGREDLNVRQKRRSLRGGSAWNYEPRVLRVANRHSNGEPDRAAANIGFRCAY